MDAFAVIDGLKIHYTDTGNAAGKPVVLMHGWGCDVSTVASVADAIGHNHRVISIDLPGHGQSDEPSLLPDGSPWGVYEYANAVEKLMNKLDISNASLIGHSYGGRVAIILGSRMPVEKIVLVDSAGIKPKRPLSYYRKVYTFKLLKKLLPLILGKKKGNELIEKRRGKAGSADYRNASPMMRMVMSKSVNQDLRHLLPSIKAPTLLIWGENDTATPLADGRLMEKLIPDSGLVSLEGAGHYSFLDNPSRFKAIINVFL